VNRLVVRLHYTVIRDMRQQATAIIRKTEANGARKFRRSVALGATLENVVDHAVKSVRTFKTAWFARAARKAHISDEELCSAIRQVMLGQADDLGGGVFKKRLRKNQYRSIILAMAGHFWVYEYLFAKQDRANIEDDELAGFRRIAKAYGNLTAEQVNQLVRDNDWMEICNGDKA